MTIVTAPRTRTLAPHRYSRPPQLPLQLDRPAPPATWDPLSIDTEAAPDVEDSGLPPLSPSAPPPKQDVARIAGALTSAVAEVLIGTRPAGQVQRWLAEEVWHTVRRRAALTQRSVPRRTHSVPVKILRVHPCHLGPDACEASVVFHDGERVRAAAVRLNLHRGRWRVVALRIG